MYLNRPEDLCNVKIVTLKKRKVNTTAFNLNVLRYKHINDVDIKIYLFSKRGF